MKNSLDVFQKNCEKWSCTNPQKALLLPYIDCKDLTFCITKQEEQNLKFQHRGETHFFHCQQGALDEAKEWFKMTRLAEVPLIYVYGVGLGYYYQAAQSWLQEDPSRRLVFLEDNLAVIHRLFETNLGFQLVHDPQVQLHFFEDLEKSKELFHILYWNFFLTTLTVSGLKLYQDLKAEQYAHLKHTLAYEASVKNSLLTEYLEYGVGFFKNFYPNILSLEGAYLADELFGKFHNIPAIICGAGPSLEKNLSLLGKLLNKALVFAGGSALNALSKRDIQPHFGAGIDPNVPQYDRLSTNSSFETPFFYRNRLLHKAFNTIHGPRLYVTGSGGYDISSFFEEGLGIKGTPIEEGHNVVNFCLEIAHALGCNPIIFVGMDLAYTDMKAYASGVIEDNRVEAADITTTQNIDQAALLKTDIYGKPIYTLWKWIAEAEWIGDFAKAHPDIRVINATEGGLGFPGVPNKTLQEVADKYLKEDYDFKGMIHSEIFNSSMPQVKKEKISYLMQDLQQSLTRCVEDFEVLIEETRVIQIRSEKDQKVCFPQQTGKAALYESDLAEEIGYRYVLHIFNEAYTRVLNRELQGIQHAPISEVQQALEKLDLLIKRFVFLRDVAKVNLELIKMAMHEHVTLPAPTFPKPGKITCKQTKVQGVIQGSSSFHAQGQILSSAYFEKGLQEGVAEFFYPNGQPYSRQVFKEGVWEGKQEFYYPTGTVKTLLNYEGGKLITAQLFYPDGTLKSHVAPLGDESLPNE